MRASKQRKKRRGRVCFDMHRLAPTGKVGKALGTEGKGQVCSRAAISARMTYMAAGIINVRVSDLENPLVG